MKDPSRSSTSPSIINDDVIINGHSHEEDNPFAEYMWMENEEEFNRQIEEELWEEEFIERCFQEMLEEEEEHECVSGKMVMTAKSSVSAPNCPLS